VERTSSFFCAVFTFLIYPSGETPYFFSSLNPIGHLIIVRTDVVSILISVEFGPPYLVIRVYLCSICSRCLSANFLVFCTFVHFCFILIGLFTYARLVSAQLLRDLPGRPLLRPSPAWFACSSLPVFLFSPSSDLPAIIS